MNEELAILKLADDSRLFEEGNSSVRLIINSKIAEHPCLFGFRGREKVVRSNGGLRARDGIQGNRRADELLHVAFLSFGAGSIRHEIVSRLR